MGDSYVCSSAKSYIHSCERNAHAASLFGKSGSYQTFCFEMNKASHSKRAFTVATTLFASAAPDRAALLTLLKGHSVPHDEGHNQLQCMPKPSALL